MNKIKKIYEYVMERAAVSRVVKDHFSEKVILELRPKWGQGTANERSRRKQSDPIAPSQEQTA